MESTVTLRRLIGAVFFAVLVLGCGVPAQPTPRPDTPTTAASTVTPPAPTSTPTPDPTPLPPTPLPDLSPEARAYLEEALDIIQTHSIKRDVLDWDALRARAYELADGARAPEQTHDAIRFALGRLLDSHSRFMTPAELALWSAADPIVYDNIAPAGTLLEGCIGYVRMEDFVPTDEGQGRAYVSNLQQIIADIDAQCPCGWIVDLRRNGGGNMWPMLAGIGPILGEGRAGAFVNVDGQETAWFYRNGQAFYGEYLMAEADGPAYELAEPMPPVAVLISVTTASSGEAIAVSFQGRPNSRFFGVPTIGLVTGNEGFELSDGAMMWLATVWYADRTGQVYKTAIVPDENVDTSKEFIGTVIPPVGVIGLQERRAIRWLLDQPACAGANESRPAGTSTP
jgi:carboxyl-terminal processing protease